MMAYVPAGWDRAQQRRHLDALLVYLDAPGPEASGALQAEAPGVEAVALTFADTLLAHPCSGWRQRLRELREGLDQPPVGEAPPEPAGPDDYLLRLHDSVVQLAWFAYMCFPSPTGRHWLRSEADTGAGEWLANVADALRSRPGSAWRQRLVDRGRGRGTAARRQAPVAEITARPRAAGQGPPHYRSRSRRPLAWTAAVAAAAAVVAVVATFALGGSPPGATGPAHLAAWELAGAIDQPAWQVASSGGTVAPFLTCPAAIACFAGLVGRPGGAVVESTADDGTTWRAHPLPGGVQLTAALACPDASTCIGAGIAPSAAGPSRAVAVATADGGATWTEHRLPAGLARVVALACPAAAACLGVGFAGPPSLTGTTAGEPAVAVSSTDGGTTWTSAALPGSIYPFAGSLACSSPADCVVAGATTAAAAAGTAATTAAALYTSDGGAHWAAAALPGGLGAIQAASCAPDGGCTAFAAHEPGTTPDPYTVLRSATTGGRSWQVAAGAAPSFVVVSSLSCPTATSCWASGQSASVGTEGREGAVAVTHDGGASWAATPLPHLLTGTQARLVGSTQLDLATVSAVSCADVAHCLAVGRANFVPPATSQVVLRSTGG